MNALTFWAAAFLMLFALIGALAATAGVILIIHDSVNAIGGTI
jgi:hypothetical protein